MVLRAVLPALALAALASPALGQTAAANGSAQGTLTNPLLPSGPDPWVTYREGYYYYIGSGGGGITIRKTRSIAELRNAPARVIWRAPQSGPYSREVWAPELHFLRGKWYVYFASDAGTNKSHRLWVLENPSPDPTEGEWVFKGKVADTSDKWAIDGTVFENRGRMYLVWSGWEGDVNGVQSLYIAELENPWTVKGPRVRVSIPDHPWEKIGDLIGRRNPEDNPGANPEDPLHVDVNEGPSILQHDGKIFLVYSAGGCWTDYYGLGMLTASDASDLLKPDSWTKSALPVFWQSPQAHAYGPGHNAFFRSPDGKEDWIIYHANPEPNQGCGGRRTPRAQPFRWNTDGTPDFGRPVAAASPIAAPSGEQAP